MNKPLILDAGPLGQIAHPKPNPIIEAHYRRLLILGRVIVIPEIADFEVRRSFLLNNLIASLARLDALKRDLVYLPLDTLTMLKAAELWAVARKRGRTTADPKELNGDVILAAQALQVGGVIVTDNTGHLAQFVEATTWKELQ